MKYVNLYEDYLVEQQLNEIGEGVTPFSWTRKGAVKVGTWMSDMSQHDKADHNYENLPVIEYQFKSDKATYVVKFVGGFRTHTYINFGQAAKTKQHDYNVIIGVSFDVDSSDKEVITNFGEQFRVISTVSAILEEVMKELQAIEWIKVTEIHIMPKLEDADEGKPIAQTKRGRVYLEYIKKQGNKLKGDWTADIQKDRFVIKSGKWSSSTPGKLLQL
jgi:hypothetical protein